MDPLEQAIREDVRRERQSWLIDAPAPDKIARTNKVARDTGQDILSVEGREDQFEIANQARALGSLAERYPAIGSFTTRNPRAAAAARDDADALGVLADSFENMGKLLGRAKAGTLEAAAGLREFVDAPFDFLGEYVDKPIQYGIQSVIDATRLPGRGRDPGKAIDARAAARKAGRDELRNSASTVRAESRFDNWIVDAVASGIEFVPISLAAAATRNPMLGAGIPAASVAGNSYNDAQEQGLTGVRVGIYAASQGSIEYATEKLPASKLISAIANKSPFGKVFIDQLTAELPGEQVATVLQDLNDWAVLPENEGKAFSEYLAERPDAAVQTALATVGGVTTTASVVRATQRTVQASQKIAGKVGEIRQAYQEKSVLDKMVKGAEASKLRQRDPEAFRELLREQAKEAGSGDVFVPGSVIREFQQSDSYDADSDPFDPRNWEEADATGGDMVMPLEDVLTDIVGTPAWDAIKDHVRLTPGGMSKAEADTTAETLDDAMADIAEEFAKQDAVDRAEKSVRERLVDQVALQFGESFTAPAARNIAELAVTRAVARSERLGKALDGKEFDNFSVRQVMPEGVAEAVRSDTLDLAINAMRQGQSAEIGVGPSILEFIKARGGINDPGGDLASMGVPKGMLKAFNPDQGSLGGISGAGDFGIDTVMSAAIESGFFPELAGAVNEAGPSQIDTQVLLDAIGRELGGDKVYGAVKEDRMRVAGEELRSMLSESGLDPERMSDAEVRDAVAAMEGGQAEGRGYEQSDPEGSDAFRSWAGTDAPVIEPDAINDMDFAGQGPFVMRAFHGTTHEFEVFDASISGNKEGQFGAVNYFTSSEGDASGNYLENGTDLTQRIELRAEQIEANDEIDMEAAREIARKELAGETPQVLEVFLRTEKPFVVGGEQSPWMEFSDFDAIQQAALERVAEDEGVTVDEIEANRDDYEDAIDEARWEAESETPNALMEAIDAVATRNGLDAQELYADVAEMATEGAKQSDLEAALRASEALAYAEDEETGGLIGYHVLGEIIQELGFDSIILKNAGDRFANMDIEAGTAHVHVFDSNKTNIKSVNNRGTFDGADARILYQGKVTEKAVEDWAAEVEARLGLKSLSVYLSRGDLKLNTLIVERDGQKQGTGTKAMEELIAFADANGLRVKLSPALADDIQGTTSRSRLVKFYKRFGFYENKGRKKDFTISEGMIREPVAARSFNQSAFHGSPHIFDRFSTDAMGTGEGAQAYGWGLYFAGKKAIAEHYRSALAGRPQYKWSVSFEGKTPADYLFDELSGDETSLVEGKALQAVEDAVRAYGNNAMPDKDGKFEFDEKLIEAVVNTVRSRFQRSPEVLEKVKEIASGLKVEGERVSPGRLYEVEIPEDNEFLLWDKPLSEQPEKVRDALQNALDDVVNRQTDYKKASALSRELTLDNLAENTGQEIYANLSSTLDEGDQAASLALKDAGIAGIKYLDGTSRTEGDGTFNYVVFDDNAVSIRAYEQEARGRIIFQQNQKIIELFQSRNLSTPIHELGHMWLEELQHDAGLPDAPQQLKDDWAQVVDWFSTNGQALGDNGNIPTEAHELWARGIERYVMEGKAPSTGLTRIFETMRGWMVSIYKTVERLRSPITPEIREVFDRLLATDEQIEQARETQAIKGLFEDAASIGMSEQEFAAYQRQVEGAKADSHANLLDKTMRAVRTRETDRYRKAAKGVKAEETLRIDAAPIYKAMRMMKESRVSKEWIEDEFGVDALGLLPVRVPPLYADGGIDPNIVAEMTGYSGATEMIEALIGAERAHRQAKEGGDKRSMRVRAIETATDEEMKRRYGDPLGDGSIEREAIAAVHSEKQGEVIASELRILSRKSGKRATPYRMARDWARGKIRGGVVAQEASGAAIQRYARNAAKAGRAAEAAMLAQDADEAFRQKQFQMMNNALVAEAKEAGDEVDVAVRRMDKIARAKTRKSVDQDYLEQAQALLEAVDLRKRSQVGIDKQGKWEAWVAGQEAEGRTPVTPASFETTINRTNWSRLSVDTLLALDEQITQILYLGRKKQELLTAKKNRDIYQVASAIQDRIREQRPDIIKDWRNRNTLGRRLRSSMKELFAVHRKMASLARQMDGGVDGGPLVKAIILPMTDRYNWEAEQTTIAHEKVSEIMKPFLGRTKTGRNKMTSGDKFFPSIGESFNLEERMFIVANMGNASNYQRLRDGESVEDGFNWNEAGLKDILDSLTKEQMDAVQELWDLFESYKPLTAAKERRVNGVEPVWIEAQELETRHGTYRGGYFPVKYDSARSTKAQQQADADEAKRQMQGAFTASTTRRSYTKERADKVEKRPLRYSFSTVSSGLTEIIHDLAFHEYLIDANRLMRHPKVGDEIRKRFGPEVLKQFTEGLEDVAVGNAPAANAWEAGLNHVRFGATIAGLAWNLKTAILQPFGITQSVVRVGPKWIGRGVREWTNSPMGLPKKIKKKSVFMRERGRTQSREINEIQNRIQGKTAAKQFLDDSLFYTITKMQMTVDIPTWWGAYEKAIAADEIEVEAILLADQAVKDAQGGGQVGDLARIQRGGPLMKLWTNFYSFFSTTYNLTAESYGRTKFTRPGDVVAFMSDMVLLYTIPSMLGVGLKAVISYIKGELDDDEDWIAELVSEHISYIMGTMVGVREMTGLGQSVAEWTTGKDVRKFDGAYGGPAGLRALQEMDRLGKQVAQGEMDHALRKSSINAAGILLHLPSGQINKTLDGAMALEDGDSENPLVLVTGD